MHHNPWEQDFRGFESQLFGRAKNDVGIDALAPAEDAVIYAKRPSPQSRSPIGTVVERDYSPIASPQHIDTLFRPSYQSVEFHRSLSPLQQSPASTPRHGTSPRSGSLNPPPPVQAGVSPRTLSNSLAGLTLTPPPNPALSLSPRSLTPGSASPLPSPNRSPRFDDQFDMELSGDSQDFGLHAREPIMPQPQQQPPQRRNSISSPPTITLAPPGAHHAQPEPLMRGSISPHYGGRLSPSIGGDDGEQPPYISSASPFMPTVSDVSYISSESGYGQSQHGLDSSHDNQSFGEHPYGEYPSRTLFVRNIHSSVDDEELRQLFGTIGPVTLPIRSMYTQCKHRGFVMISYYDLRDAKAAMHHLQNKVFHGRPLDIHYSIPKDNPSEKDQNQGTLVVFNLPPSITNEELILIFSEYGEVKEVRHTPNKKHHRFIEFYDIRHAEKAMKALNKTEIKGKKIKIEPSRAGSPSIARKAATHPIQPSIQHQALSAPSQLSAGVIHGFDPREDDLQGQMMPPHSYGGAYGGGASSFGGGGSSGSYGNDLSGELDYPLSPLDYISGGTSPNHVGSYNDMSSLAEYGTTRLSRYYASPPAASVPRFSPGQQQLPTDPLWGRSGLSGSPSPITSPTSMSPKLASPRSPRGMGGGVGMPKLGVTGQMMSMPPAGGPGPLDMISSGGLAGGLGVPGGALAKGSRRPRPDGNGDQSQFVLDIDAVRSGNELRTTLMIKNIPNKYSQKMLLAAVDERHKGQYDFFYLPIDFKNKCNVGYAFINFIDCQHIVSFYEEFHGKKWEKFNSEKICAITYARIQGKLALIAHFQNSSLMCEDRKCRPIIFHSDGPLMGEQERFPVSSAVRQRRKEERKAADGQPVLKPQGYLE